MHRVIWQNCLNRIEQVSAIFADTLADNSLNRLLASVHNPSVFAVTIRAIHFALAPLAQACTQQSQRVS